MMRRAAHLVLAGTVADASMRQSIEDDLLSEYEVRRSREGWAAAERWVAAQLFLSFHDLAGLGASGSLSLLPQAAGRFYAVLLLLVASGTALAELALRIGQATGLFRGLMAFLATLGTTLVVGYLVAAFAAKAPLASALGVGVVAAAVTIGAIALGIAGAEGWYPGLWLVLFPLASLAGGLYRVRERLASSPP